MTCHVNDYPYGHAGCCRCERDLDLSGQPAGLTFRKGNLLVYLFYCANCAADLAAKDRETCGRAIGQALELAHSLPCNGLAMVTSLALQAHGGDLVRAYELGVHAPRVLHDAILAGQAEATTVPPFGWETANAN
jgi:hypothetical protein